MDSANIYRDIATRTNGDIYIGVVGPVRVGKSTFITKFMEEFVIPNISNKNAKACAIDELPQSADGLNIMTTQPKFVPAESVCVKVADNVEMNVKLIDCVGYLVDGATGHEEDGKPRMVKTPWQKEPMPLKKAAEFGTHKVVAEHSTIAILMTTDGSFGDIERQNFIPAEKRLVSELKAENKPFVIVLNSSIPTDDATLSLAEELRQTYGVSVCVCKADELSQNDVNNIFTQILNEFPLQGIELKMPDWLAALDFNNPIITELVEEFKKTGSNAKKIGDFNKQIKLFENSTRFEPLEQSSIKLGEGKVLFNLTPKPSLFYEVLSLQCGMDIKDEFELVTNMRGLSEAKQKYDKMKTALQAAEQNGYGVVLPTVEDLNLEEPEVSKQGGGRFGVKLRASAPSLHIMRVDLETEISPMIGSEQQCNDMVAYLKGQTENGKDGLLRANMFGKSMQQLLNEGLSSKLNAMPVEAQKKMRKTLTRIVNEGKGGIICILL